MTDVQAMVAEFHGAFNLPNRLGQGKPDAMHERTELRKDLIEEEFDEFLESHQTVYVDGRRLGFYHGLVGVDDVHRSNMSKLDADGKPIYREDGKVLKGPNYSAPNIKEVLGLD